MENNNVKNKNANQAKVQKIIEFVPEKSLMKLDTNAIANTLSSNLEPQIPNFCGTRVMIKNNAITIQISFLPSDVMVIENALIQSFDIPLEDRYTLTAKAKEILEPFADINSEIPLQPLQRKGRIYLIATLNPKLVIENMLERAPEGYTYAIENVLTFNKGNAGTLLISLNKIQKKKQNNRFNKRK